METDSRDLTERWHEAERQLTPWVLPGHLQTHVELLPSVNRQKISTCVFHSTTMTNRSCSHLQPHAVTSLSLQTQNNHLRPSSHHNDQSRLLTTAAKSRRKIASTSSYSTTTKVWLTHTTLKQNRPIRTPHAVTDLNQSETWNVAIFSADFCLPCWYHKQRLRTHWLSAVLSFLVQSHSKMGSAPTPANTCRVTSLSQQTKKPLASFITPQWSTTAAHNCSKIQEKNRFNFQLQYYH